MNEKRKFLTGVPKPTTGTEKRKVETGNNPIRPRKVPVERVVPTEQGETRSNNPVVPTPKPKPPASEGK
jgi:hypothetical protein